jgi:hypothetical protein
MDGGSMMRRALMLLAGVLILALGCGGSSIDSADLERQIAEDLAEGGAEVEVSCPEEIAAEEGAEVECRGTGPEGAVNAEPHGPLDFPIEVTITDEEGSFEAVVPPDDPASDVLNP